MRYLLTLVIMAMVMVSPAINADAAITFAYPSPNSWVRHSDYLVLKLNNPEITGVTISVNGVDSDIMQVGSVEYRKQFQDIVIVQPLWDKGKNEVTVRGFKGSSPLETGQATIFFHPPTDTAQVPQEFHPFVMHTAENEKLCLPCHEMNPIPSTFTGTLGKKSPCYSCHKKMANQLFVHEPVGTFSCGYCHNPGATPKYAVEKRDAPMCSECHADKWEQFKKSKYRHGPIDAGLCEVCHDVHGTPYYGFLRQPANELCLSCHEKIGKTPHAVRSTSGGGHPLSGKPDLSPKSKGRMITCASCHNPHSADVRFYFQSNSEDKMQLCQYCHAK